MFPAPLASAITIEHNYVRMNIMTSLIFATHVALEFPKPQADLPSEQGGKWWETKSEKQAYELIIYTRVRSCLTLSARRH